MKLKLYFLGFLTVLFSAGCGSVTQDTPKDIFVELRKLNAVDESKMKPNEHKEHMVYKDSLNKDLSDYLQQPENISSFPSIEDKKASISKHLQDINNKDESQLGQDALDKLRIDRNQDIQDLQDLLEQGKLFQDIKDLNNVDESILDENAKKSHQEHKSDLNNKLTEYLNRPQNHSQNLLVEQRKQEILNQLTDMNNQDESQLSTDAKESLHNKRSDLLDELLGLLDASIVPTDNSSTPTNNTTEDESDNNIKPIKTEDSVKKKDNAPKQDVSPTTKEAPVEKDKEKPTTDTADENAEDNNNKVKEPREDLFPAILGLNKVDESKLNEDEADQHNQLKKDLNDELKMLLSKEENQLQDESSEKHKNDLQDELININNTDETQLSQEDLDSLRNRRKEIVEQLQDLLKNGKKTPAAEYGIVSKQDDGIKVNKERADGSFNVTFTNLLFAFNKTDLRPAVKEILTKIIKLLNEHPEATAKIGGHSDNIGPVWAKEKIANGRATNAKQYLVNEGISEDRLEAKGYSDLQPIAKPFTKANRQKNRRVEVHIQMAKDEEEQVSKDTEGEHKETENMANNNSPTPVEMLDSNNNSATMVETSNTRDTTLKEENNSDETEQSDQVQNSDNTADSLTQTNSDTSNVEENNTSDINTSENEALASNIVDDTNNDISEETDHTGME